MVYLALLASALDEEALEGSGALFRVTCQQRIVAHCALLIRLHSQGIHLAGQCEEEAWNGCGMKGGVGATGKREEERKKEEGNRMLWW